MLGTDYRLAASQLLRALRGRRSQAAFCRALGYRSNTSTDWECGRRYPTAPETLRIASRLGVDVEQCFAAFSPVAAPRSEDGYHVGAWLNGLRGTTKYSDLARRTGRSRHAMGRWLAGQGTPRLHEFLELVDAMSGRTADLVAGLVPIHLVPILEPTYRRVEAARRLSQDFPWSEAVLRIIETEEYQHLENASPDYIAARLKADPTEIAGVVAALETAGVVERQGTSLKVVEALVVDTRSASMKRTHTHWATVALSRTMADDTDWFAYNVISVSSGDLAKVEEILRAAYREVRSVVQSSSPTEEAALLTMQLARWRPLY
jgi:hypothetical protein